MAKKRLYFEINEDSRYDMKTQDLIYEYKTSIWKLELSDVLMWLPMFIGAVDADIRRYGSKEERIKHKNNNLMTFKVQSEYDYLRKLVANSSGINLMDDEDFGREMKTIDYSICEVVNWVYTFAKDRGMNEVSLEPSPRTYKKKYSNFVKTVKQLAPHVLLGGAIAGLITIIDKHDD